MTLSLSDVNTKVRYRDTYHYGSYKGLLLGLSADHKTAFVEWDSPLRKGNREAIHAHLLVIVEESDDVDSEISGGGRTLWEQTDLEG